MNKLYNTQKEIASNLRTFLENNVNNIRKTQLNIIPYIMFGMIQAESCSAPDIAKVLNISQWDWQWLVPCHSLAVRKIIWIQLRQTKFLTRLRTSHWIIFTWH